MRPIPPITVAVICIVARCAAAVPPCDSSAACLRVLEASQRTTRALSARFEQTKHVSLLAEPLVTRGQFAFRQPDQVVLRVDDPALTVRIDRDGIHLPDLPGAQDEVAALAPFGTMMRQLSGSFTGALSTMSSAFTVTAAADGNVIRVHLVPRDAQWRRTIGAIDLSFAGPNWVVAKIHIEESLGDSLDIVFSNVHRNDDVANAAFDATPGRHD